MIVFFQINKVVYEYSYLASKRVVRIFKNLATQTTKVRYVSDIFKTLGVSGEMKRNLRGGLQHWFTEYTYLCQLYSLY